MLEPQVVASLHAGTPERGDQRRLWKAAIKWPMYSVAIMPALLAAGWRLGRGLEVRTGQLLLFLLGAVLLLAWENLANDVFDADTGVDVDGKPHSVVNLTGRRDRVAALATVALLGGLALMAVVAMRSSPAVLVLVGACCGLGYAYQGPPLRLGYHGLGEPLCWLAFGPCATAATLIALAPLPSGPGGAAGLTTAFPDALAAIPWADALVLGAGPALATTLVLFCSHFHQVRGDGDNGKRSPVVRLGTERAAALVPWFVAGTLALEGAPVLMGWWPWTALLGLIALPPARSLIRLLDSHHHASERISHCKFLALRFQTLNGLGLACGLAIGPWLTRWPGGG